jgi:iron complex transport system substrate-binding protein
VSVRRNLIAVAAVVAAAALSLPASASDRIVSIGGSITEILYALGAGDRIVAVDTTSLYPEAAPRLPQVGYLRSLAAEPIIALKPTLILADGDAGPPAVIKQIREAGVRIEITPKDPSVANVYEKIRIVSELIGKEEKGIDLAEAIRRDLRALAKAVAAAPERPRVLFLLSVGRGSPLAGGNDTHADTIIALSGAVNAAAGFTGYKPMPPEGVVAARPDVILVVDRTAAALGGEKAILARAEIAATPAGRAQRLIAMDGLLLLGFGPRTALAARELATRLHPGLRLD